MNGETHDGNCSEKCYRSPDVAHVVRYDGTVVHYVAAERDWIPVVATSEQ